MRPQGVKCETVTISPSVPELWCWIMARKVFCKHNDVKVTMTLSYGWRWDLWGYWDLSTQNSNHFIFKTNWMLVPNCKKCSLKESTIINLNRESGKYVSCPWCKTKVIKRKHGELLVSQHHWTQIWSFGFLFLNSYSESTVFCSLFYQCQFFINDLFSSPLSFTCQRELLFNN